MILLALIDYITYGAKFLTNISLIFEFLYILFAITAAGVVPFGGRKKSPRTSSIVQIIFLFWSFESSKDIQSVQNTHI